MLQQWAIKTENLRKDYPGMTAVHDLNFGVEVGRVHGFLGPNGAGKSTTLRMVCGLLRPTAGRALVLGIDPVDQPDEAKAKVGLLPEHTPLYRDMSVEDFLLFSARLRHVPATQIEVARSRVIEQAGLGDVRKRLIGNLSKGFRQRVGIAQALIHSPPVIILDEPTAGLDPQSVVEIRALIRSLKGERTIVFSSHILTEVEEVCDTISIIHHGQLKASGSLSEIKQGLLGKGTVKLETDKPLTAAQLDKLRSLGGVESLTHEGLLVRLVPQGKNDIRPGIVRLLTQEGVGVLTIELSTPPLEEVFMAVTRASEVRV